MTPSALYAAAVVAIVTIIPDGMNLVSYQYAICQQESNTVLELSEFFGSKRSVSSSIPFNHGNFVKLAVAHYQ